jgi:type I restriction enzyme S subunit
MSWNATQTTLGDETCFRTLNGLWKGKKPPFVEAGVIRNTNFTESGRIDFDNIAWLEVEEKQLAKRQLEAGDIIIERSGGGPKQPVGRVVFFDRNDGRFSFSNFTSAIRVGDRAAFDAKFVFYSLLELYQSGQTEDLQRRTTGIRNLDFSAYKERAVFPRIPLPEQRKIAEVLGLVQRAMEQQERLIEKTVELKKTLLHQLFTQGTRGEPQKQTEFGPVPESWVVRPCEELCVMITVGVVVKPASHYVASGVPAFRSFNVREDRLETDELAYFSQEANDTILAKSKLRAGDVLVVRTGYPGTSCVVPPEFDGANCIDVVIVRPRSDVVRSGFLSRFFNSPSGKSQAVAAKHGLAQQHLNVGAVKKVRVPVPPLKEQDEIENALATVQSKLAHHRRKHATLSALFRTLLHQLMTAQLRVHDLELPEQGTDNAQAGQIRAFPNQDSTLTKRSAVQ